MIYFKRILFSCFSMIFFFIIYWSTFSPIYYSENIIITYAVHPFNICESQPILWNIIKVSSIIFYLFSIFILFFCISKKIFYKKIKNNEENKNIIFPYDFSLLIGLDEKNNFVKIPEKSLYQNILITGTVSTKFGIKSNLLCN